jgi:hypothetical protein
MRRRDSTLLQRLAFSIFFLILNACAAAAQADAGASFDR